MNEQTQEYWNTQSHPCWDSAADVQERVISIERESQYHSVVCKEMKQKWEKKPEKDRVLDWILINMLWTVQATHKNAVIAPTTHRLRLKEQWTQTPMI